MRVIKIFIITLTLVIGLIVLCGCFSTETEAAGEKRFVEISDEDTFVVVYDKETLVMYAVSDGYYNVGNVTLLVDADGKPLLYKKGE